MMDAKVTERVANDAPADCVREIIRRVKNAEGLTDADVTGHVAILLTAYGRQQYDAGWNDALARTERFLNEWKRRSF